MRLQKILAIALALCCLTGTALAELSARTVEEKHAAGSFKAATPRLLLQGFEARQAANEALELTLDKFRVLAEKVGDTAVEYEITAEKDDYISFIFLGGTRLPELNMDVGGAHAVVLDKKTGAALPLEHFVRIPGIKYVREQVDAGKITAVCMDGHTELDPAFVKELKAVPQEYFIDKLGNVYLVATEADIFGAGTPLLALPAKALADIYVSGDAAKNK